MGRPLRAMRAATRRRASSSSPRRSRAARGSAGCRRRRRPRGSGSRARPRGSPVGDDRAVDPAAAPRRQRRAAPQRRELGTALEANPGGADDVSPASATRTVSASGSAARSHSSMSASQLWSSSQTACSMRRDALEIRAGRHLAQRDAGGQPRLAGDLRHRRDHDRLLSSGTKPAASSRSGRSAGRSCPCSFHSNRSPRSAKTRTWRAISSSRSEPSSPPRSRVQRRTRRTAEAEDAHDRAVPLDGYALRQAGPARARSCASYDLRSSAASGAGMARRLYSEAVGDLTFRRRAAFHLETATEEEA